MNSFVRRWGAVSAVVLFLQSPTAPHAFGQSHLITNYTTAHGLPQNVVYDLHQDRLGFLWICTMGGVCRFDGTEFVTPNIPGLISQRVWCMYEEAEGDLWFGTRNGLVRLQRSRGVVLDTIFGPESGVRYAIRHILQIDHERLWMLGERGILARGLDAPEGFVDITASLGLPPALFHVAAVDDEKNIWLGSAAGLFKLPAGENRAQPVLENITVRGLLPDDSYLWISTQSRGLLRLDRKTSSVEPVRLPKQVRSCYSMIKEADGSYWLATSGGVIHFRGNPVDNPPNDVVDAKAGLNNEIILPVLKDHQGNLWLGSHDGLARLSKAKALQLSVKEGLANDKIHTTAVDSFGRVWIGTGSGVSVYDPSTRRVANLMLDGTEPLPYAMTATADRMWVANEDGLSVIPYDHKGFIRADRVLSMPLYAVAVSPKKVLAGGRRGAASVASSGVRMIRQKNGAPMPAVFGITPARDGTFWLGTERGLLKASVLDDSVVILPYEPLAFLKSSVGHVYEAPDSSLWISTENKGIFVVHAGAVRQYDITHGLADNIVNMSCPVGPERVWVATNRGISMFDAVGKRLLGTYSTELLTGKGGAIRWISETSGSIYLSTADGVIILPVAFEMLDSIPLHIADLRVNGESLSDQYLLLDREIRLPADASELEFNLIAITMIEGRHIRYQYRLVGFDEKWSRTLNDRRVRYTGLGPGVYTLQARAVHPDGSIGGTVTRTIAIRTPFWLTWWFGSVLLLFGVAVLYSGHKWRLRRLEKKAADLAQLVEKRTEEVRTQSDILARQKTALEHAFKTLQETQSQLIQAEKMSALGRMVAGVAHEINNPLTFIHGNIPILRKGYERLTSAMGSADAQQLEDVLDACERGTLRIAEIVKRLKNFARLDQSDLEDLDVSAGLDHACEMVSYQYPQIEVVRQYETRTVLRVAARDLQQAFYNLMINAVEAQEGHKPVINVGLSSETSHVIVSISDRGRGISAEIAPNVFDPFFTTKKVGQGLGLGLTLVYNVVAAHGGQVTFSSNKEDGTVFKISLPRV